MSSEQLEGLDFGARPVLPPYLSRLAAALVAPEFYHVLVAVGHQVRTKDSTLFTVVNACSLCMGSTSLPGGSASRVHCRARGVPAGGAAVGIADIPVNYIG